MQGDVHATHKVGYSHGSVRNQIIHLMSVDEVWFSELQGVEPSEPFAPATFNDREIIRTCWDRVEKIMQEYLKKNRITEEYPGDHQHGFGMGQDYRQDFRFFGTQDFCRNFDIHL